MTSTVDQARLNMIKQQLRTWEVLDERVLAVMSETQRELFVPNAYQGLAYSDIEIPIGDADSMLAPKFVGRMLQAIDVQASDKVLEIGTGTGYVTACLARLGGRVRSMEINAELAEAARERLQALQLRRIEVITGDALAGSIDGGPFDIIVITGALPDEEALPMLRHYLAQGGRLFVVIGESPLMTALLETRLSSGDFRRQKLFETCIPTLQNVPLPERFVF
ncbi:MAG TPA: protein-L-isoaspartate O-methyltransferase [Chromatiaceae bacterium]|jgi:protein-L-isoaspartate(D-aspartate) O-methyltransferase|nr:MAG: protein-L-isoaspartate O-methyltransferase [Thiohalocapsa sp. PB-PSB1]HBG93722.1 protein-L-isoaspartate O-methyltransferase [Chromatiaceae bacterium]HCS88789.1 protein-L-isoaspartate O-methyltransferase [Chromatiaceae bacterium]